MLIAVAKGLVRGDVVCVVFERNALWQPFFRLLALNGED